MSEIEDRIGWSAPSRWSSWDSAVGLGLFFVPAAVAVGVIWLALR
jgi:hypothetical protein